MFILLLFLSFLFFFCLIEILGWENRVYMTGLLKLVEMNVGRGFPVWTHGLNLREAVLIKKKAFRGDIYITIFLATFKVLLLLFLSL